MRTEAAQRTRFSASNLRSVPRGPEPVGGTSLPVAHPAWGARFFGRAGVLLVWLSLGLGALTEPPHPVTMIIACFVLLACVFFEIVITRHWRRWPVWLTHAGVVLGNTSLLLLVLSHRGHPVAAVAAASIFVWPAAFAGLYLGVRATIAHVVLLNVLVWLGLLPTLDIAEAGATTAVVAQASAGVAAVCCCLARALRRQSEEDLLTGLRNRRGLYTLAETLPRPSHEAWTVAVIDLDGFKQVNDMLGHEAGDALLMEAASAWRRILSPRDALARTGGDEFVLIHRGGPIEAEAIVAKLRDVTPPQVGLSAGLASWASDVALDDALRVADTAMYEAKRSGGRRTSGS